MQTFEVFRMVNSCGSETGFLQLPGLIEAKDASIALQLADKKFGGIGLNVRRVE